MEVPTRPLIGTLGTTLNRDSVTHLPGGPWGGNMDVQEVCAGATVSFPVFVPGALLNVGDVHARQSDLEFSAVETYAEVTLRVSPRSSLKELVGPRILDADHIATVGFDEDPRQAFEIAARNLWMWLCQDFGLAGDDAYFLMGAGMEARCTRWLPGVNAAYVCKLDRQLLPSV